MINRIIILNCYFISYSIIFKLKIQKHSHFIDMQQQLLMPDPHK